MVYRLDPLDSAFGALADRTRRAILAQLAGGERSISEIARRFDMTLPAVSKHVYVLERAGLAEVRLEGRTRHCRLVAAPLRDAASWIDRYRGFWDASFDRLATYLDDALAEESEKKTTEEPGPCLTSSRRPPRRTSSKSAATSPPRANASSRRGDRPKR